MSVADPYTSPQTYIDDFDPVAYYNTFYHPEKGGFNGEWLDFVLRNLHEAFTSGGVKGDVLMEFGAGPTIYQLLSACEAFKNIITSDFLEQNLKQIQKWLRKDPDAFDWSHIVKFVCELEGNSDSESCKKKEEKLRKTVTKVLKYDVLEENPCDLLEMPQADCLISCHFLEAPCRDMESFTKALRTLIGFNKPGGHILMHSTLESLSYYVGQKKFSCLPITREELEVAFKEAGYEIVKLKIIPCTVMPGMEEDSQRSHYFVHARKPGF